jgi:tripartite-type tricarboxylate transporter receptor subunit TctC
MRNELICRLRTVVAALSLLMPVVAMAQAYPSKPVRLILPTAPGGGIDILGRILAARLGERWSQPVVPDNKPGANFVIGTDAVAKAAPDGYTLLFVASPALTINPLVLPDLPYHPTNDLAPISIVGQNAFILIVNNAVPADSVAGLLAHLRANPGKLNYASNSASTRLVSELFKSLAKVEYAEINYKGGALTAASVASGETQLSFVDISSAAAVVQSGRARALAVTTARRTRMRPEVPTLDEAGVPGFSAVGLTLMMAPAKTPREIIAKINSDIAAVLGNPEVIQRIEAVGSDVLGTTPEEAVRLLREDTDKWARLIRERSIRF